MFRTVAAAAVFSFIAFAQTPPSPTFEVATLKAAAPQQMMMDTSGGPGTPDPGQWTAANIPLSRLIMTAYHVRSFQVSGPSWIDTQRFDVMAKLPRGATREQFQIMLQNLLAERLKLVVHTESKDVPIFALVTGKTGIRMKESASGASGNRITSGPQGLHMQGRHVTMSVLADVLSNQLGRPVMDLTGLTADYDYDLDFSPEGLQMVKAVPAMKGPATGAEGGRETAPTIFTALQEQLGLKLESRKGPVDLIVVDRAEKTPTEN